MKGSEFNEKFPDTLFAVFSDSPDLDMTSNDYLFERINESAIRKYEYIYIVNIPDDCVIRYLYLPITKYIGTKLVINYPVHRDYFEIVGDNYALDCVTYNGFFLKYIKYKTPEICLAAVQENGFSLKYVEEQTHEICLAAVQSNRWALEFVKEKNPEICLAAIQKCSMALECVKEQTPELCLAAVQNDGWALQFVKEQTPEICLAAVQNTPGSICYVDAKFKHLFQ